MASEPPDLGVTADVGEFAEAVKAFRARVPMTDDEWDALVEAEKEFAFTVGDVAEADMITQVWEALDAALDQGLSVEDFKGAVGDMLEQSWGGENPGLIENIFRTNTQTAYNAGRFEIHTAPTVKKARPYWRLDVIDDSRTSDYCHGVEGVILEQDNDWWDGNYVPRHFNCRSIVTALSEKEAEREGITRKPPSVKAMEGFGRRPTNAGRDWTPDLLGYPEPVASGSTSALTRTPRQTRCF